MVKITFSSSNNQVHEVEEIVARKFENIQKEIEDNLEQLKKIEKVKASADQYIITLPEIKSDIFAEIIGYYNHQNDVKKSVEDLKKFDEKFLRDLSNKKLLDVCASAAKLETKKLFNLTIQKLSDIVKDMKRNSNIKGKSTVEFTKTFAKAFGTDDVKSLLDTLHWLIKLWTDNLEYWAC